MVAPLRPGARTGSRPRSPARREGRPARLALGSPGWRWRGLPPACPPRTPVPGSFSPWRDHGGVDARKDRRGRAARALAGRVTEPTASGSDRPRVRPPPASGGDGGEEAGNKATGRPRSHGTRPPPPWALVGPPRSCGHPAGPCWPRQICSARAATGALGGALCADGGEAGDTLRAAPQGPGGTLAIIRRTGQAGCERWPSRGEVEHPFAGLGRGSLYGPKTGRGRSQAPRPGHSSPAFGSRNF